jgi:hypothetical protein
MLPDEMLSEAEPNDVLSYIVTGKFTEEFTGDVTNVLGDPVRIENGILITSGQVASILGVEKDYYNGIGVRYKSSGLLQRSGQAQRVKFDTCDEVTYPDQIKEASYAIWSTHMTYMMEVKKRFQEKTQALQDMLQAYFEKEEEVPDVIAKLEAGDDIEESHHQYFDFVRYGGHLAAVNAALNSILRTTKNSN